MNVIDEIEAVVKTLSKIEEYQNSLSTDLSKRDLAISDLMHYIESLNLNAVKMCRIVKELKKLRVERRKIKRDMELLRTFELNKPKLSNNYEFLMSEISKTNKNLNRNYVNRVYSEDFKELWEG